MRRFVPVMQRSFERFVRFPKPLIAAINGHAIAGGLIIALGCDQRLAARGPARFGLTEILVGVVFPPWALELARFTTPPEHFTTLICTGRTWKGEDALVRGLLDELVEPERLLDRACEVAQELAAIPADTFAATKLAVRRPLIDTAEQQAALMNEKLVNYWSSSETLERVGAFAKRTIKRRE